MKQKWAVHWIVFNLVESGPLQTYILTSVCRHSKVDCWSFYEKDVPSHHPWTSGLVLSSFDIIFNPFWSIPKYRTNWFFINESRWGQVTGSDSLWNSANKQSLRFLSFPVFQGVTFSQQIEKTSKMFLMFSSPSQWQWLQRLQRTLSSHLQSYRWRGGDSYKHYKEADYEGQKQLPWKRVWRQQNAFFRIRKTKKWNTGRHWESVWQLVWVI